MLAAAAMQPNVAEATDTLFWRSDMTGLTPEEGGATLPDGDYPFIDRRLPLSELSMIEVPLDLERLLKEQAIKSGIAVARNRPVELRCRSEEFGDAMFLIYWPEGQRMHMLAPKGFVTGRA